jgi:hypothetical protein
MINQFLFERALMANTILDLRLKDGINFKHNGAGPSEV